MLKNSFSIPFTTHQLALACLGLMLISIQVWADTSVRASVDRHRLSMDETLTLTLLADSMLFSDEPDVSSLEADFHVLHRQQSSRSTIINGKLSSSRQWDYTLAPKREGDITIPALPMGKYQTRPLTISVRPDLRDQQRSTEQVFLESDVSPRRSPVQAQLDYTVKIFTSVNFLDASLEPLAVENAVVENLGETRYRSQVNGRDYQVIERRYAIFPQASGELLIPALTLQARVEGYRRSLLDPGRQIYKRSQSHRVRVTPPEQNFKGQLWLPAKALSISAEWSQDLEQVQVGDSLTRRLTIRAEGLMGSQLPALPELSLNGAKLYPDQATTENELIDGALIGIRSESLAIIPTHAGELRLPELRLSWWNTQTQREEVAVLPAQTINVRAAPGSSAAETTATAQAVAALPPQHPQQTTAFDSASPLWLVLTLGVSLLLNLLLLLALSRRKTAAKPLTADTVTPALSEQQAFKSLQQALNQDRPQQWRQALLCWAAIRFGRPISLAELAAEIPSIAALCQRLDASLYSHQPALDTQLAGQLGDALKAWRKKPGQEKAAAALAPLYPD